MTLRTRSRERGTLDIVHIPLQHGALPGYVRLDITWRYNGTGGTIKDVVDYDVSHTSLGLSFPLSVLDLPPTFRSNSDGYLYLQPDDAYVDYVVEEVRKRISIPNDPNASLVPFVLGDSREKMDDTIGSGFPGKQGKEFIVNPMSSSKTLLMAPVPKVGAPDLALVGRKGSIVKGAATVRVDINVHPTKELPLGLPASLFHNLMGEVQAASATEANSTFADAFASVQSAELELLTVLAESGKTLNYLYGRLRTLSDILGNTKRALRRLDFNEFLDYWLEARYAIRPIIYDVQNVISAMQKDKLEAVRTFRAFDSHSSDDSLFLTHTEGDFVYDINAHITRDFRMTAGCYGQLEFNQLQTYNLGLLNFAQVGWEVVPYSFVVDWFINISGLIASINPNPIYKVITGWQSAQRRYSVSGQLTVRSLSDPTNVKSGNFFLTNVTYDRIKATDPVLVNFNLNLSVPKIVDLIALARRFL